MHFDVEATSKHDPTIINSPLIMLFSRINRIKLIPCSDTYLVQSEELLVIHANRKQARELPRRPT